MNHTIEDYEPSALDRTRRSRKSVIQDSNLGHHPYEGCALPAELSTDEISVEAAGFEPATPCVRGRYANQAALRFDVYRKTFLRIQQLSSLSNFCTVSANTDDVLDTAEQNFLVDCQHDHRCSDVLLRY